MRLGALLTPADGLNPHHLVEEAKAIEAAGFDSLWSAHAMGRGFMMHDPRAAPFSSRTHARTPKCVHHWHV